MNCYNHPDIPATATCTDCGEPICAACTRMLRGKPFCVADYELAGYEGGDVAVPLTVPAYHLEKKTERIPPHHEQLALVEKYEGPTNFIYSAAVNTGIQPQETAEILAQYENTRMVIDTTPRRRDRDGAVIWALVGLVSSFLPLFFLGIGLSGGSYNQGGMLGCILTAPISLFAAGTAIWKREESSHPRVVLLIAVADLLVMIVIWFLVQYLHNVALSHYL